LHRLFADADPAPAASQAREDLAGDLGRGIAGLVNAFDPDLVTLGGLSAELRQAAATRFDRALREGLMTVHRDRPPILLAARAGEDAPLIGAGLSVFEHVLDADRLARWAGGNPVAPT
jgi:predicted NBD/HSP70 family sugar kinase